MGCTFWDSPLLFVLPASVVAGRLDAGDSDESALGCRGEIAPIRAICAGARLSMSRRGGEHEVSAERARLVKHAMLSRSLASLTDHEIVSVLAGGERLGRGIGGSTMTIRVAGTPVFVKLVALTDLERAAGGRSTANLFDLPTWYHYGVGSAGFSAWREVLAHELATGWVLDGTAPNFPLLHHWRVVPLPVRAVTDEGAQEIERAVAFWDGSIAVRGRLQALAGSAAAVALFLEHVPFTLQDWFRDQLAAGDNAGVSACALVQDQLIHAIRCMASNGVTHFDAHFGNVLTDGERLYVSDFGLAASTQYEVTTIEKRFLETTVHHDLAYAAAQLVNAIVAGSGTLQGPAARNASLRRYARGGAIPDIPKPLGDVIQRYAPVAVVMNDFYWRLHEGRPTTTYPAAAILTTLHRADLLA